MNLIDSKQQGDRPAEVHSEELYDVHALPNISRVIK
jgi:hypothetical protein